MQANFFGLSNTIAAIRVLLESQAFLLYLRYGSLVYEASDYEL